jgi:molybdopterin molybdotransferase
LGPEEVPIFEAAGRVLVGDVSQNLDLPPFDRAAVDGIAVRAEETIGASTYNPCVLQWAAAFADLPAGGAVRMDAGEALPHGADAVIRAEQVEFDARGAGTVSEPIVAGSGVERRGSQGRRASALIAAGRRLRPADIGLLTSAGVAHVSVVGRPRVRCLITDGTIEAGQPLPQGKVYDANGPLLRALIERDGGIVVQQQSIARDRASLRHALLALADADIILVAGGTGSGSNDHAAAALVQAGELAIHGVALRHAETAGMGVAASVPVFLLPGTPSACLVAYEVLAGRAIRRLGGRSPELPFFCREMTAARKIVSEISMMELRPVRCRAANSVEPIAAFAETGLRAVAEADGFVLIPEKSEGYPQGVAVTVYLYDG